MVNSESGLRGRLCVRSSFAINTLMSGEQPILTYKTKFDKNDLYIYIRLYVASETILIVVSESYIQLNLNKIRVFVNFRSVRQNQLFAGHQGIYSKRRMPMHLSRSMQLFNP